jgi:hypothetical protein
MPDLVFYSNCKILIDYCFCFLNYNEFLSTYFNLIDWTICFFGLLGEKDDEDGFDKNDFKSMMKWGRLFSNLFYRFYENRYIDDHMN